MAAFTEDVVVDPFPFSDLSNAKSRPALVIKELGGEDLLLSQITSKNNQNDLVVSVVEGDLIEGSLQTDSFVRPEKTLYLLKTYNYVQSRKFEKPGHE